MYYPLKIIYHQYLLTLIVTLYTLQGVGVQYLPCGDQANLSDKSVYCSIKFL